METEFIDVQFMVDMPKLWMFLTKKEKELQDILHGKSDDNTKNEVAAIIILTYLYVAHCFKNDHAIQNVVRSTLNCTTSLICKANPDFTYYLMSDDSGYEKLCKEDKDFIADKIIPNICSPLFESTTNFKLPDVDSTWLRSQHDRRFVTTIDLVERHQMLESSFQNFYSK